MKSHAIVDGFIGTLIAVALTLALFWFFPVTFWFDVRSVQVLGSTPESSPSMVVDRTINRSFTASWQVTVMRKEDDGWTRFCNATGENDYSPEVKLPKNVDLDWWTWPVECKLIPGDYIVRTLWEVKILGFITKDVRVISNVFTVASEETPNAHNDQ